MNTLEKFEDALRETFIEKFHEQFPEAFVVCTTMDKDELATCNKSKYSYYMAICNSLSIYEHWNWKISPFEENFLSERESMLMDLKNSDNVMLWAFENIKIGL